MKKRYLFFLYALFFTINCFGTWSIIVVDSRTKEIGIAGASCTYSVYGIGGIIPGKGAVVVQAMSNKAAKAKGLQLIMAETQPAEILKAMMDPMYDPEEQQYALVCINFSAEPKTYTGSETNKEKAAFTAKGITVQGNTLVNQQMMKEVLDAALAAQKQGLGIEEVLMLALEAGAKFGGDNRCGNRKAASAFITVAKPGDDRSEPYLNIIVNDNGQGLNAVTALRKKFDTRNKKEND